MAQALRVPNAHEGSASPELDFFFFFFLDLRLLEAAGCASGASTAAGSTKLSQKSLY